MMVYDYHFANDQVFVLALEFIRVCMVLRVVPFSSHSQMIMIIGYQWCHPGEAESRDWVRQSKHDRDSVVALPSSRLSDRIAALV